MPICDPCETFDGGPTLTVSYGLMTDIYKFSIRLPENQNFGIFFTDENEIEDSDIIWFNYTGNITSYRGTWDGPESRQDWVIENDT